MNKHQLHFVAVLVTFFFLSTTYTFGYPGGITGYTLKGSSPGCTCHTSSSSSSVTLTIQGPTNLNPGETGNYTVQMTYTSSISAAGMDIASSDGSLATSDSKLKVSGSELTHPSAQTGTTSLSWPFKFTAPLTAGTVTLYATGCAIKSRWNHAPNFSINVSALPVELVSFQANLSKKSVNLNWATATELNNAGFDVERRFNNGTWEKIYFIAGNGNSNSPKQYRYTDPSLSNPGIYSYRLKQIDNDGSYEYSKIVEVNYTAPIGYSLEQNYPNPFNPSTIISYNLPIGSNVKLVVYNAVGEIVKILENQYKEAGYYHVNFHQTGLPSGILFYKLEAGPFSELKKMILVK
jgi:hypothetical protein